MLYKRIRVGALELGQLAPVQHPLRQVVTLGCKFLQDVGACAVGARLALAPALEPHLLEQHLAQLLGRSDCEGMAGQGVDLALQRLDPAREILGERDELALVHQDAGGLHPREYCDQGALDPLEDRGEVGRR